ncbi:MAG: RES family NAD+ phosphorylase [Cellvibrio sp.]|nr:RES family NAD+ phosphorylase [Cellvibrio sp.]
MSSSDLSGINIDTQDFQAQVCYRLMPSKFPPIALFEDVANHQDFEILFAIQAITNPRLRQELGNLNCVPVEERPYGIRGCSYALGPFVHVNPSGSRFSRGYFGIYYAAVDIQTAIAETRYHQEKYFSSIEGLKYDRLSMRCLKTIFSANLHDIRGDQHRQSNWYLLDDYHHSQLLGDQLKKMGSTGIVYDSVRNPGHSCYGLFTPKVIADVIQAAHYSYIWDGIKISVAMEMLTVV